MSINSTNPTSQISDQSGNTATLDKDGIRVFQEVTAPDVVDMLKQILAKLVDIEEAIQELDNV